MRLFFTLKHKQVPFICQIATSTGVHVLHFYPLIMQYQNTKQFYEINKITNNIFPSGTPFEKITVLEL